MSTRAEHLFVFKFVPGTTKLIRIFEMVDSSASLMM